MSDSIVGTVKVKPLVWTDFANVSASPNDIDHDDNLAVALCSYFDGHENCPDDGEEGSELDDYDCWKVWVSESAEKVLRRIAKTANDRIMASLDVQPVTVQDAVKVFEVKALIKALKPFADIGVSENPDFHPIIRMDRDAIIAARAALRAIADADQCHGRLIHNQVIGH